MNYVRSGSVKMEGALESVGQRTDGIRLENGNDSIESDREPVRSLEGKRGSLGMRSCPEYDIVAIS